MRTYYPVHAPATDTNGHPWMLRLAWTSITLVLGVAFGLAMSEILRSQSNTTHPNSSETARR